MRGRVRRHDRDSSCCEPWRRRERRCCLRLLPTASASTAVQRRAASSTACKHTPARRAPRRPCHPPCCLAVNHVDIEFVTSLIGAPKGDVQPATAQPLVGWTPGLRCSHADRRGRGATLLAGQRRSHSTKCVLVPSIRLVRGGPPKSQVQVPRPCKV